MARLEKENYDEIQVFEKCPSFFKELLESDLNPIFFCSHLIFF